MDNSIVVYLAGKIRKNGWRNTIVPGLRNHWCEAQDVTEANQYEKTIFDHVYTSGPFFISCDHGCYHGDNIHGVGANGRGCGESVPGNIVPAICMNQIERCNFVFAYINSRTCYGTLCEIGYAFAKRRPVAVMFSDPSLRKDMWFVAEIANMEFDAFGAVVKSETSNVLVAMTATKIAGALGKPDKNEEVV